MCPGCIYDFWNICVVSWKRTHTECIIPEMPSSTYWLWDSRNCASLHSPMLILTCYTVIINCPFSLFPLLIYFFNCLLYQGPHSAYDWLTQILTLTNYQSSCLNLTNPSKGNGQQPVGGRVGWVMPSNLRMRKPTLAQGVQMNESWMSFTWSWRSNIRYPSNFDKNDVIFLD